MATPVIMPKFGMTQEEGTIIRWLRKRRRRGRKRRHPARSSDRQNGHGCRGTGHGCSPWHPIWRGEDRARGDGHRPDCRTGRSVGGGVRRANGAPEAAAVATRFATAAPFKAKATPVAQRRGRGDWSGNHGLSPRERVQWAHYKGGRRTGLWQERSPVQRPKQPIAYAPRQRRGDWPAKNRSR